MENEEEQGRRIMIVLSFPLYLWLHSLSVHENVQGYCEATDLLSRDSDGGYSENCAYVYGCILLL